MLCAFAAGPTAARGEVPDRAALEEALFGPVETSSPAASIPAVSSPPAKTSERPDLEAELFGESSESPEVEAPAEPAASSGDGGLLERLQDSLRDANDRLALGGNLFVRLEYRVLEEGEPSDFALVSPNTLDLYLDARPVDRVRTYVRARLAYDPTAVTSDGTDSTELTDPNAGASLGGGGGRAETQVFLDQLWVKFDLARTLFFTVGKQRVRWGTGRIWNPTDFLNAQRFNPLALFDPRLGVSLVKLHIPFEDAGANLYAILNLENADQIDRVGAAARAEWAFVSTELAASVSWRDGEPLRLGMDASTGLGDFELRAELALLYDDPTPVFSGRWDALDPTSFADLRVRYRDESWLPQLVLGVDLTLGYGDGEQAILGLEYFYNSTGYDSADLYPVLLLTPAFNQFPDPTLQALGLRRPVPGAFQPFYLGQHYLSFLALFPRPLGCEDHTVVFTALANLSDRSALIRLDHTVRLFRFLSFRSYANVHFGDPGELRFGLEIAPVPAALPDGIALSAPLMEVGLALSTTL